MPTVGLGVGPKATLELAGLALASALTLPWGLLRMFRMPPIQSGLMAAGAGAARVLVAKIAMARVKKCIVAVSILRLNEWISLKVMVSE